MPKPAHEERRAHRVLASLDLADAYERRAHDFIQRFFSDDDQRKVVDIARAKHPATHPDVIVLCQERSGDAVGWTVYRYQLRRISLSWLVYVTLDEAHAAFRNAICVASWPRLLTAP